MEFQNEHKIKRIKRNDSNETRIVLQQHTDGRVALDIRQWYKRQGMDNFRPTGKGISIPLSSLDDLRQAVEKAQRIAKEEGYE